MNLNVERNNKYCILAEQKNNKYLTIKVIIEKECKVLKLTVHLHAEIKHYDKY